MKENWRRREWWWSLKGSDPTLVLDPVSPHPWARPQCPFENPLKCFQESVQAPSNSYSLFWTSFFWYFSSFLPISSYLVCFLPTQPLVNYFIKLCIFWVSTLFLDKVFYTPILVINQKEDFLVSGTQLCLLNGFFLNWIFIVSLPGLYYIGLELCEWVTENGEENSRCLYSHQFPAAWFPIPAHVGKEL